MKRLIWDVLAIGVALLILWGMLQDALAESEFFKAEQLEAKGLFKDAVFGYIDALDHNPDRPDIQRAIGRTYLEFYKQNKNDSLLSGALSHFKQAAALDPEYPYHYVGIGQALELMARAGLGSAAPAREAFEKAYKIDPYNPFVILQLIRIDVNYKRFSSADKELLEFLACEPKLLRWAMQYRFTTPEDYPKISNLLGSNPEYHLFFARFLYSKKYKELAANEYLLAAEFFPIGHPGIIEAAGGLINSNQTGQAIPILESYVHVRPGQAKPYFLMGLALEKENQLTKAAAALEKACNFDPQNGLYFSALARVLENTGRMREALSAYEKAIRLVRKPGMEAHAEKLRQKIKHSSGQEMHQEQPATLP